MSKKPEPCPYCGNEQSYVVELHRIFARVCEHCGAEGPLSASASGATRKWNRRKVIKAKEKK